MKPVVLIALVVAMIFVVGCREKQQKVWGTGNPPPDWQEMFGNSNVSRLDYVQSNHINELAKRVRALEANMPVDESMTEEEFYAEHGTR